METAVNDLDTRGPMDLDAVQALHVVRFNGRGVRPPLVFVRIWREAEFEGYRALAERLGPEQPVVLLGPPPEARRLGSSVSIDAWVVHATKLLQGAKLAGTPVVGGWSFGGVIALEMARVLAKQGAPAPLALMIDTWLPKKHAKGPRSFPRKAAELYDEFRDRKPGDRWDVIRGPLLWRAAKLRHRLALSARRLGLEIADTTADVDPDAIPDPLRRAVWVAYLKYDARPSSQPVALHWCEGSRQSVGDAMLGWSPWLRGPVSCSPLEGGHFDLWEHPASLARAINGSLQGIGDAPLRQRGGAEPRS